MVHLIIDLHKHVFYKNWMNMMHGSINGKVKHHVFSLSNCQYKNNIGLEIRVWKLESRKRPQDGLILGLYINGLTMRMRTANYFLTGMIQVAPHLSPLLILFSTI